MGRLLLVFLTFSVVFALLYRPALADASPGNSEPNKSLRGVRALLQNPVTKEVIADPPTPRRPLSEDELDHKETEPSTAGEAPESPKIGKHHSSDGSIAGGGVIIGGLVTAIFAAVYCYIRVTRRKHNAQALT